MSKEMAKMDWQYLIDLNIYQNFDKDPTILQLKNYHLALFIAYYRNAHDRNAQSASIHNIKEIMPEAMKELINRWTFTTPYEYNPDIFFQW